jgi:hypothetical protein
VIIIVLLFKFQPLNHKNHTHTHTHTHTKNSDLFTDFPSACWSESVFHISCKTRERSEGHSCRGAGHPWMVAGKATHLPAEVCLAVGKGAPQTFHSLWQQSGEHMGDTTPPVVSVVQTPQEQLFSSFLFQIEVLIHGRQVVALPLCYIPSPKTANRAGWDSAMHLLDRHFFISISQWGYILEMLKKEKLAVLSVADCNLVSLCHWTQSPQPYIVHMEARGRAVFSASVWHSEPWARDPLEQTNVFWHPKWVFGWEN